MRQRGYGLWWWRGCTRRATGRNMNRTRVTNRCLALEARSAAGIRRCKEAGGLGWGMGSIAESIYIDGAPLRYCVAVPPPVPVCSCVVRCTTTEKKLKKSRMGPSVELSGRENGT
eukprot:scaffold16967_cov113-Isochrysis_galbana.AAC.8